MKSTLLLAAFLFSFGVYSQKTNFSGNWSINAEKTVFGQLPKWGVTQSYSIQQENDKIVVKEVNLDDKGEEHVMNSIFTFDGKLNEVTTYTNKKRKSSLAWSANGKSFVLTIQTSTADGQLWNNIIETWWVSDDGKNLIIDKQVEQLNKLNNGLKYSVTQFYDKK